MSDKNHSLDELLDAWAVHAPGMWENELSEHPLLKDWYAVSNTVGIVAYFGKEEDACRFRLAEINREPVAAGERAFLAGDDYDAAKGEAWCYGWAVAQSKATRVPRR